MHHMLYTPWSRTSCFFEAPLSICCHSRNHFRLRTAASLSRSFANNRFLHVAFSSYGAFWLSFATIFIPNSGIVDAYKTAAPGMEDNAIGIFLIAWMIVTFLFL